MTLVIQAGVLGPHHRERLSNIPYGNTNFSEADLTLGGGLGFHHSSGEQTPVGLGWSIGNM